MGTTAGRRRARRFVVGLALSLLVSAFASATAAPLRDDAAVGENLKLVAEIPYKDGSHMEHATIKGRDYLFAATTNVTMAELRVIDVTTPERPKVVAFIKCGSFQSNIQISADKKTLILGVDGTHTDGFCVPTLDEGFVTIDISNPRKPTPIGFMSIPGGSHSTATHPTRPLVYNAPEGSPAPDRRPAVLEVFSIANPAKPRLVNTIPMPGLNSPHDISFNKDGSMAAIASITAFHLLDTSDPVNPTFEFTSQCPGCQHSHEARFTPDSKTLVVNDESMSGLAYPCPGGALYFYDVVGKPGAREAALTGTYSPGDVGINAAGMPGFCTPHVFDISDDGTKIASTWHSGGVRYLDISKRAGVTLGKTSTDAGGAKEIGSYTTTDGDYFTAKLYKGPYIYAVDMTSGLQIFKITGK
jgi:hypothetical protein